MHLGGIADHMVDQIERRASVRRSNGCQSNQWLVGTVGERLGTSAFAMNIAALLAAAQ